MARGFIVRWTKRTALVLLVAVVTLLGLRIYEVERGPPLEAWHLVVPHELAAAEIDRADWAAYLQNEARAFATVRDEVTRKLDPEDRVPVNRYFDGSPVHPARFAQDWNRSHVLLPEGRPVGAAVFLHGLTDAPYSLRHLARQYRERGFVAVVIRLPGHGTVPAGLTEVAWEDWLAAARLAVREAKRLAGPDTPLHLVGYSNGGALALMYALDALDGNGLAQPSQLVLLSPMVGVTAFARFAGLAALPALLPAFAKAAWLGLVPEYNPFKYNSFPVNAARQSYELTQALQEKIQAHARAGRLAALPPILAFQSVMDATVSTRAVVSELFANLPANGSELVLFDINRATKLGPVLSAGAEAMLESILPPAPRHYRVAVVTNAAPEAREVVERLTEPGAAAPSQRALGLVYPRDVFSLSHLALPFPLGDGLYGLEPDPADDFGVTLGAIAARGERGTLVVDLDTLLRMSSNPFYPYMAERIEQTLAARR